MCDLHDVSSKQHVRMCANGGLSGLQLHARVFSHVALPPVLHEQLVPGLLVVLSALMFFLCVFFSLFRLELCICVCV